MESNENISQPNGQQKFVKNSLVCIDVIAIWKKVSEVSWRFFISLKLTFILLLFLGVGAIIGMSYDQTLSFDELQSSLIESSVNNFSMQFFELYDVFHSWWYSFIILLLAANLTACSIERLPRILFDALNPRPYLTHRRLKGLSLKENMEVSSLERAFRTVEDFLQASVDKVGLSKGSFFYFRERYTVGRFGVYIVHIALLIIMFASIYTTQVGVDGNVLIEEGKATRFITAKGSGGVNYTRDLGFYIGCKDFRLRTFLDNSPMEFESVLFIQDDRKKELVTKTVRVNDPLTYAGFTFYQSSFRPIISEKIVEIDTIDKKALRKTWRVRLNTEIELDDGSILTPKKLFEDFAGLGQALRLEIKSPIGLSTYFHVFRRHPGFDKEVRQGNFAVEFIGSDQQYATGLSIGRTPGIFVIFSGFALLILGMAMCFFMTPRRMFARIVKSGDQFKVILAAQGFRNLNMVREEFMRKVSDLRVEVAEKNHV